MIHNKDYKLLIILNVISINLFIVHVKKLNVIKNIVLVIIQALNAPNCVLVKIVKILNKTNKCKFKYIQAIKMKIIKINKCHKE